MKHLSVFSSCLLITMSSVLALAADSVPWHTDYAQAVALARQEKKPLYVHFYSSDTLSKAMGGEVFANPAIAQRLAQTFVVVHLDVSQQTELATQMSVTHVPTDIILDANGQLVHRRQGGIKADRFTQYLDFLATKGIKPAVQLPLQTVVPTVPVPPVNLAPETPVETPTAQVPSLTAATTDKPQSPMNPSTFQQELTTNTPAATQAPVDPFTMNSILAVPVQPASVAASPNNTVNNTPVDAAPFTITGLVTPAAQVPPLTATATEPSPEPVPAKTVEVPLALDGYCPVALSVGEKWIAGNPAFYMMYHGQVFRFSTEEAMKKFLEEPMKYAPAAMGEDVVLMTDRGKRVYGSRKFGAWYKDRMFLFSSQESLEIFAAKPEYYRDIALKYETAMKGGNTRF